MNSAGAVVQTYDYGSEGSWFSLNLDPNGSSFWAGNFGSSNFYRFNIATGAVEVGPISTGTRGSTLFGITVKGELTAGGGKLMHTVERAKTKCGKNGKDYIKIGGSIEGFSKDRDLEVKIEGSPDIFGVSPSVINVTIPATSFTTTVEGEVEATATIPTITGGRIKVSLPDGPCGDFHINIDGYNMNTCPPGVEKAELTLYLNGIKGMIVLRKGSKSKFHS
ncbi:MAG: hypothetical protein ACE5F1_10005 [Planctomycetota bacterium]